MASSFDTEYETPEMENLTALAENLVYLLPGCADVMIRKTIQEVYRDFCRRTCCLCGRRQFTLEPDGVISVSPVFGGLIDCISEVRYDRHLLGKCDYVTAGGRITFRDSLVPDEDAPEECWPDVEVTWVEIPKINSEHVPSFFIQKYGDEIHSGVLSRLMSMTGRPWSDAQLAAEHRLFYENAICEERMRYYGMENGDLGRATPNEELI